MTELLAFADRSPFFSFVLGCMATTVLVFFACALSGLGNIGRRTTHVHHHHSESCRENHEKGPCETES